MSDQSRRKLLKSIAAGSGAVIAGKNLPDSWSRPVVDSVMLPAHAQTSCVAVVAYTNTIDDGTGFIFPVGPGNFSYLDSTPWGYPPTAGATSLHTNNLNGSGLAALPLPGTLDPGIYTVVFDVGNYNNFPFVTITNIGLRSASVFLIPTSSSTPTPASGEQLTWSLTYNLSAGDIASLDFAIDSGAAGPTANGSIDNLIITRTCP